MKFKDSQLAHKYCQGEGIELGAASHNPFNLLDCINVAPNADEEFYNQSQINMCGEVAKIDIYGTATDIPLPDGSKDYIVSSHVVEHVSDLIGAFLEWNRVLTNDGIIFMIFPKRDALPSDVGRPLSTVEEFDAAHIRMDRHFDDNNHIWVFSLQSMLDLIEFCNEKYNLGWVILETEETDSKVGNGHTVVCTRV